MCLAIIFTVSAIRLQYTNVQRAQDREKTLVVEAPNPRDKQRMVAGLTQLIADVQMLAKSGQAGKQPCSSRANTHTLAH